MVIVIIDKPQEQGFQLSMREAVELRQRSYEKNKKENTKMATKTTKAKKPVTNVAPKKATVTKAPAKKTAKAAEKKPTAKNAAKAPVKQVKKTAKKMVTNTKK